MQLSEIVNQNGAVFSFPQLPTEAKKSIIQFYFIECGDIFHEEDHPYRDLKTHNDDGLVAWDSLLPAFDKLHKDDIYAFYEMPTQDIKDFMMSDACEFKDRFESFEEYHLDYCEYNEANHSPLNRWPSIAECEEEGIIDGWHRFHDYVRKGHCTIPLIASFIDSKKQKV